MIIAADHGIAVTRASEGLIYQQAATLTSGSTGTNLSAVLTVYRQSSSRKFF